MDDRYYNEEINYLLESGKEFARKHPQKARMLHFDDIRSRDPNVERLLESFAFLTSRIRKKLDDDLSHIADGLLSLIWPSYLNPVPSFCILSFSPDNGDFSEPLTIERHSEIDSIPLESNIACRFRTCFEKTVLPLELSDVAVETAGSTSTAKLSFSLFDNAEPACLEGQKLDIQLFGELLQCWKLYHLFLGKNDKASLLEKVSLKIYGESDEELNTHTFNASVVAPAGLSIEESLLPNADSALWSYSLIRDFFIFPEKFQAFHIDILDTVASYENATRFEVMLHVRSGWPSNLRIDTSHFRVNTVPIVNLFNRDAEPIRLDHLHHRYTVRGDIKNPEFFQVYSIDSVQSIEVSTGKRKLYEPLFSARHNKSVDDSAYFTIEREKSSWGGLENYISFKDAAAKAIFPTEEVISLTLTCTNGKLPSQLLPNQINNGVSSIPGTLHPTNISHPTQCIFPDTEQNSLWRWLSHASLNYVNILSASHFKTMLQLHDFSNSPANQHKVEGVKDISSKPTRQLFKGAVIPGNLIEITLNESHFADLGEIQLFAKILSGFLSSFASINSYVQVSITIEPSNKRIVIVPQLGSNMQL